MKPTNIHPKSTQPQHHVIYGDVVYCNHPEHGALSGEVAAVGKDGIQIRHEKGAEGLLPMKWEHILGHKARRARKLTLVERGEDGGIAEDEDGKRVFVEGELPEESEPLNKSIQAVTVPAALTLVERAAIDASLIAAGFEPSLEYIRETYGEHWTKRVVSEPLTKAFDDSSLINAIAEVKASGDAAVAAVRTEMATHISMLAVAIGRVQNDS